MIMIIILAVYFMGGAAAWISGKLNTALSRWTALIAAAANLVISVYIWAADFEQILPGKENWILDFRSEWIPRFGISVHFSMDGLSLLLVILTSFIGVISVIISWTEIKKNSQFFYFNLMFILAGITGVFISLDLFLFYFFWEVMLIPMYFLIALWGHENRQYAAYKFFIFTQAGGLLLFLSILGLYFAHGSSTGIYTFDYTELLGTTLDPGFSVLLMSGFLAAFLVKIPAIPFHTWLPDAHTEAPTAGSVILAGLLLKTGAYGILRFVIPLFPQTSDDFMIPAMIIGSVGILYGAKLAFAQTDLKRLVAYSSISHMGFVLIGAFTRNELAIQGVIMQMLTHAVSTGALFVIVGIIQERIHTRNINEMGGLWEKAPGLAGITMVFSMASLGLPGLGNFIAEILILAGSFQTSVLWTSIASAGLIASAVYSLKIVQRVFHGKKTKEWALSDINTRETLAAGAMMLLIIWLGVNPQPVLDTSRNSVKIIMSSRETETQFNPKALLMIDKKDGVEE